MFLGECTQKKKISPLPKNKQNKEKKQNFSLFHLLSFLFSLFSSSFLTTKNFFPPFSCSRFHLKRKTHLSSLRAQFRAHTSSRAEERHPPLCCSLFLQYYYKECFERKERERRERVVCGYIVACIVLIGEKSTRR